jgi:lipoyl(octanoyl) transferase
VEFVSLPGLTSYERAREIQKDLVEKRARDEIVDTVLFLEHSPVITRGRGLQWTGVERPRQMPMPAAMPAHFEFSESERGGDLTYHGPGQLVVYPIVRTRDIAGFLRGLENLFISEFQDLGLMASAKPSATGVWVGEQKVASIGIAIRKWVTYHGIAINAAISPR